MLEQTTLKTYGKHIEIKIQLLNTFESDSTLWQVEKMLNMTNYTF